MMLGSGEASYRAFISYSRVDRITAKLLQARLEQFVLPASLRLVKPGLRFDPQPLRPVFRDEDELVPGGNLPGRIRRGLEGSEFLLVLCSPAAARSEWVEREILDFHALGKGDAIIAIVIDGTPHAEAAGRPFTDECLPRALRFEVSRNAAEGASLTDHPAEPLWVDWRADARADRNMFLRVVAALLSLSSFDELVQRDARRRRRQRLIRGGLAIGSASIMLSGSLLLGLQVRHQRQAESLALADLARAASERKDFPAAARYAIAGIERARVPLIGFRPVDAEAELASAAAAGIILDRRIAVGGDATFIAPSPDGRKLLLAGTDVRILDVSTGRLAAHPVALGAAVVAAAWSHRGDRYVLVFSDGTFRLWDAAHSRLAAPVSGCAAIDRSKEIDGDPPTVAVAFAADDGTVRIGSSNRVCVIDAASGRAGRPPLRLADEQVAGLLPNGDLLVSGHDEKFAEVVRERSPDGSRELGRYEGNLSGPLQGFAVSPDGMRFAANSSNGDVPSDPALWLAGDKAAHRLAIPGSWSLSGFAFSPGSKYLAARVANADNHGRLQLWRVGDISDADEDIGKVVPIETLPVPKSPMTFLPDRRLAMIDRGRVALWRVFRNTATRLPAPILPEVRALGDAHIVEAPDRSRVAVIREGRDGSEVQVRWKRSGKLVYARHFGAEIQGIAFAPDNKLVVIRRTETVSWAEIRESATMLDEHGAILRDFALEDQAVQIAISPTGRFMAVVIGAPMVSSSGFSIQIWDLTLARRAGPIFESDDGADLHGFPDDHTVEFSPWQGDNKGKHYKWSLDPALFMSGRSLVARACASLIPGTMSRRSAAEFDAAPMLDRARDSDACAGYR